MNSQLQQLIRDGLLEKFEKPFQDIEKVLSKGKSRLLFAKENFARPKNKDFFDAIYTAIYDSVRITGEAFLLLNGYRAKLKNHHKTIITVTSELMQNDQDMKFVLIRLNKMRKTRNILDYGF